MRDILIKIFGITLFLEKMSQRVVPFLNLQILKIMISIVTRSNCTFQTCCSHLWPKKKGKIQNQHISYLMVYKQRVDIDIFLACIDSQIFWATWRLAIKLRTFLNSDLSGIFEITLYFHYMCSGIAKKIKILFERRFCCSTLYFYYFYYTQGYE